MFLIIRILSFLPLRILYLLSSSIAPVLSIFYRKNLVLKHLKEIFPDKSERDRQEIAKKFYQNFADVVVEIVKSVSISEKALAKRVRFLNPEIIQKYRSQNQPVLFYASHQCNWEWMALASRVNLGTPGRSIYQSLDDKKMDRFIQKLRSRFGGIPLNKNRAAREILRLKNTHTIIGLVADQAPPRDHVYWTHFMGKESDFYPGLVTLPYLMQAPAVFGKIIRKARGRYDIEIVEIGTPPYAKNNLEILRRYVEEIEQLISKYPHDYLWTHNRWKHKRTENEKLITFFPQNTNLA